MALIPATAASAIASAYLTYTETSAPSGGYQQAFADAYDTYAVAGELSQGGGAPGMEDKSIISGFLSGLTGNTTVTEFATMFANYWATCLLVPDGGAISVVNDASSQIPAFEAAIIASITQSDTQPYFQHLVENIQSIALPQVTWTVTMPPPLPVRLETVS